jgi:hypothetical protein
MRIVCIANNCLLYYKKREDVEPAGVLKLTGCKIYEVSEEECGRPLAFCIEAPGGRKLLACSAERSNMVDWITSITEACDLIPREVRRLCLPQSTSSAQTILPSVSSSSSLHSSSPSSLS